MLKQLIILCLWLSVSVGFAQSKKQECYNYLGEFAPFSLGLMQLIEETPSKFNINGIQIRLGGGFSPEDYFRGNTKEEKIGSLNTVVHESHHQFNSVYAYQLLSKNAPADYNFGDTYTTFYYNRDDILLVKHTEVFNSNELKKDIPKELQSFRYKPYIVPKTDMSSQVQGIYGLLDEFHSYYLGTKTGMETFPYFQKKAEAELSAYLDFVSNTSSSYWAFYEFKYFCLKYLEKAKTEYPEIYQELFENKALRQVYTKTTSAYEALTFEFLNKQLQIIEQVKASGQEAKIEDGYFWIGNRGVGNKGEKTDLLIAELNKPELVALHKAFLLN